jgi:phage terminase small subunit
MAKKPPLTLVGSRTTPAEPPRKLEAAGRSLWNRIMTEYEITDSGGIELLALACQTLDRAESLREQINQDGEVIRTRSGIRAHPAVKDELACRAFVVRTLSRLGLNLEPTKSNVGRPVQPLGLIR